MDKTTSPKQPLTPVPIRECPRCGYQTHVKNEDDEFDLILQNNAEKALEVDELRAENEALQAKIDRLMLEYCPKEMPSEQMANWAKHQRPVSAEQEAAIDASLKGEVMVTKEVDWHELSASAQLQLAIDIANERDRLRAFALAVMEVWPMGDLDGGDLQEIAVKHGMLKPETRHEPCGEGCSCAEYADAQEWEGGVVCYRKTRLLLGPNVGHEGRERP